MRPVRDFAAKFHTGEGNWNLVGSNFRKSQSFHMEQLEENYAT